MNSIEVTELGKCYKTNQGPSPWQKLMSRLGRGTEPSKRAREIWALKDVSFSVEKGTILGVIGPNGAGKTTLLKVLARITPPTEGQVVGSGAVAPLLALGSGLQPDLTARQNIAMYMTWHGVSHAKLPQHLDEIIEFAEIEEFVDTPLKRFSSGMYVRLAFSMAVNMQPDILLADEILAVGDLTFQERCLQRVEETGAAGMTVLFVSHDMAAIQRLCNRVIWLNAGQVVQDGDPESVVSQYEQAAWTLTAGSAKKGKKGAHGNEHGEILAVRLLSKDRREIGAARQDEELYISVTYSQLTAGASVRCQMSILTRGILAFRAVQPDEIEVAAPGIYCSSVRIPAHLLADTLYTVKVRIRIYVDGRESTIVQDKALTFKVYAEDTASQRELVARGIYRGSSWSGAVMPQLGWEVARERDLVTDPA